MNTSSSRKTVEFEEIARQARRDKSPLGRIRTAAFIKLLSQAPEEHADIAAPDLPSAFVDRLAAIRLEWEELGAGASLVDVKGSVGFLLEDVCKALNLTKEQRLRLLGRKLAKQIDTWKLRV